MSKLCSKSYSKQSTLISNGTRNGLVSRAFCRTVFAESILLEAEWTIENSAAAIPGVKVESAKFRTDYGYFWLEVTDFGSKNDRGFALTVVVHQTVTKRDQNLPAVKYEVILTYFENDSDSSKQVLRRNLKKVASNQFSISGLNVTSDPITLTLNVIKVTARTEMMDLTTSLSLSN